MGGYGSGRRADPNRDFAENSLPLDVRRLHRDGLLLPGGTFRYRWWVGEDDGGGRSIAGEVFGARDDARGGRAAAALLLFRRQAYPGDRWESVRQEVPVVWTACTKGGARPWLLCPGTGPARACEARVAVLYGLGGHFACRRCHGLPYRSQYEQAHDRFLAQALAIRRRCGQETGGIYRPFPPRPKGMHAATYARLRLLGARAEMRQIQAVARRFGFGSPEEDGDGE